MLPPAGLAGDQYIAFQHTMLTVTTGHSVSFLKVSDTDS